ncbi:MAG TPA: hypothetical protein PKK10_05805 [Woeseiaceae bacterium]|nr:hypothetical protein [Woeseiaceae bacterium]
MILFDGSDTRLRIARTSTQKSGREVRILRRTLVPFVQLLTVCFAFNAGAALADDNDRLVGERPNAGGAPEEITIRFGLLDIDAVDDKEQRFSIDAYTEIRWRDHRLAVDAVAGTEGNVRSFAVSDIWTPGLTIVNDRGLSAMLPQVANVDNNGNAVIRQRLSGRLAVKLGLQDFPFDSQRLTIDIVSYRYPPSELVFSTSTEFIADPAAFSAAGWRFENLQPESSVFKLTKDGAGRAKLTFGVVAHRNAGFYVLTLALPMTLILFLAWTVHWLQPSIVPTRMGMATATVFSLIALGVSLRLSLPQIDYLTQADRFVMYSTLLVLLSLGITVVATRWVNEDRERDAVRMTVYTRWAFPLVYILIIALTLNA